MITYIEIAFSLANEMNKHGVKLPIEIYLVFFINIVRERAGWILSAFQTKYHIQILHLYLKFSLILEVRS